MTITSTWEPEDGTVLCLNGHSIICNANASAIDVNSDVTFTLTDCQDTGTITHMTNKSGGGVRVYGTFNLYGGSITSNNCGSGNCGGGVYVTNNNFTVSGAAQIKDNVKGGTLNSKTGKYTDGTADNVYLLNSTRITIGGALTDGAKIGVTTTSNSDFTSGWNTYMSSAKPSEYFTADSSSLVAVKNSNTGELKLTSHTHDWEYIASDNSITVKCKEDGCSTSGTVTINASDTTYDGEPKAATLDNQLPDGVTEPTIKYCKNNPEETPLDGAPTNAGEYKASIKLGTVGISEEFTINPKPITVNADNITLSGDSFTYTGNAITPNVTVTVDSKTLTEGTDYTLTYGENTNAGTNAGSVTVNAVTGGNYSFSPVTKNFTITAKSLTSDMVQVTGSLTYDGTQQSPTVTVKDGDGSKTLVKDADYTLSGDTGKTDAGDYDLTITGKGNYDGSLNNNPWSIAKKPVTITGTASLDGVISDDEVGIDDSSATATFADKNVGNDKTVTFSGYSLSGSKAGNYTLTAQPTATANITPKTLTGLDFSGVSVEKQYDGTVSSVIVGGSSISFTGKVDGDDVSITATAGDYPDPNVGTKTVTLTLSLNGNDKGNYALVSNTHSFTTASISGGTYGDKTATGSAKYGSSGEVDLSRLIVTGGTASYDAVNSSDDDSILSGTPSVENGKLHFAFVDEPTKADKTATIKVNVTSANYADYTITVTVKVIDKTPQDPLTIHASKTTVTYGEAVTLSTTGGSGDGVVTYRITAGTASLEGNKLTPSKAATVTVKATKAADATYAAA